MRHKSKLITLSIGFIFTILMNFTSFGQERQPSTGFRFANSYVTGSLDAVNVNNGNVVINLPLASLPKGRGTSPGAVVTLQYNSKLFKSRQTTHTSLNPAVSGIDPGNMGGVIYHEGGFQTGEGVNYSYFTDKLENSEYGGWKLLYNYRILTTNRLSLEAPDPCLRGDAVQKLSAQWKIEMAFPDGTIREFVPTSGATIQLDGYFNVDYNGRQYNSVIQTSGNNSCVVAHSQNQAVTSGMNYVSTDGSRIRLFIPYLANQQAGDSVLPLRNWSMYFSDGTVLENRPADDTSVIQRVTDRNGSKIEYKANQIIDDLGRSITIDNNGITTKGVNGENLTTQIIWGNRWIYRKYITISADQTVPQGVERWVEETHSIPTVEQIILPAQAGGQSFTFDYYAETSQPNGTAYTNGWGELKSVTFPTGAKSTFSYHVDSLTGLFPNPPGQFSTATEILDSEATQKELTYTEDYDGNQTVKTEKTVYEIAKTQSSVTNPNGSLTSENRYYSTYENWTNGLAFSTTNADGSTVTRKWQCNANPAPSAGQCPNSYVKTEFTTIKNASNQPYLTAIRDFTYDQNGNVLKIAEYDWLPANSVAGEIPGSAVPSRITYNEYYNPTPEIGNTTLNSNHYSNPGSPKLKNVLKSTVVTDGNNNVVSRSEFYYDDPDNKGNLIETRTWDSSKGAVSNPLNAGNSISAAIQYDVYGNPVQTTDAKGVVSNVTYGAIATPNGNVSGLYPTQAVSAVGLPEQRTATSTYDFYTGLVKTATDVDNNVTNETVYDPLGRPLVAKIAVGTANEVWTQTEYNDQLRRVVVRADLFAKGDGKKVAIQHYDQLFRVRLTRTLEDAAAQNPYNEADGIKVQTRYRYDNGADPANSNGTFTLKSNPYRTGSEAEMGWTVSYADKTGKTSTVKTYAGGALPAPWGSNANITGTVLSQVDANTSTVTDQAGKQRRSITNGLGQLVRVDEPDDNGNLGSVGSPVQPTFYEYSTLGKMVKVTQGVQSRFFLYDSLGRLLRVRQPEQAPNANLNLSDSVTGNSQWTAGFTYDANGNLLTALDAKGVLITSTYDNINRALTRTYSDGTPTVTYSYDNPNISFAKGKLTQVQNSVSTSQALAFDNLGRTLASRQITDGVNYDSSYLYNLSGALVEETYPSGRKVKNTFETDGDLSKVETNFGGGAYQTRAQNLSYTASGVLEKLQIGNGLWETAQLNSRLQVTQLGLGTSPTDASIWKLNYDFGNNTNNDGNIKSQTLTTPNAVYTQTFQYDSLDRLKQATETSNGNQTWIQNFAYDRYGNRTGFNQTINGQTTSGIPSVDVNTNRFNAGQGYVYDLAGNVVQDPQNRQFIFNGDNKQVQVKDASQNVIGTYFYDGDGKRIKKVTNQESTTFVYSGGKLVAEYTMTNATSTAPQTQYLGTDMLQSPRILTDQNGQVISRRDFMPFGEDIPNFGARTQANGYKADNLRQKFTGYEKDNETGLDFAEARYYNNTVGRFTAVDPLLASGKSANPQTFNRYAYSLNRPLIMSDPSGKQAGFSSFFGRAGEELVAFKNVMLWGVNGDEQEVQRIEQLRLKKLLEHADENGGVVIQNAYGDWVRVYPREMNRINIWLWSNQIYNNEKNGGGWEKLTPEILGSVFDAKQIPGRVQSRINLMNGDNKKGWNHVVNEHFNPAKNKSQFTVTQDELKSILESKEVVKTPITKILESSDGVRYVREVDVGKAIGVDKFSGQSTSIMTVLTDKFGNLITATPGVIK